jgi:glycosyltransferase involved in cell wall biosynthesis
MPRILILASGPLCRNPRALKEAHALGNAGFEVIVAALANIERFEAFDRELLVGAPFRKVILDRLSRRPMTRLHAFSDRGAAWLARWAIRCGLEFPASLGPFRAFYGLALGIPADLTIVHAELPLCVGAALIAKGRRVAADFEDWHSRDLLPSSQASRPLRLLRQTERFLMQHAAFTSAPSKALATALQAVYGGRTPVVIPNVFPLQPAPPPLPRQAPPAFFWFSQTIGEGRGLESFLAAWSRTTAPSRLCLLGDVSESYRACLTNLVPQQKRENLEFLAVTSPESLPGVISAHDIGLALEPEQPESRYLTTTNKIFQYMNAGLAIVATPTAGQREVVSRIPGCGIIVDMKDPGALALQLDTLLGNPLRLREMGMASREGAIHHFCWERTAPFLLEAVRQAIGEKPQP